MTINLEDALSEVYTECLAEVYEAIVEHIDSLEKEVEYLTMELESIDSAPKKRRRRNEEDWE